MNEINSKQRLHRRKSKFSLQLFRGFLCNGLIQTHFDCACPAGYPYVNKKVIVKIKNLQNKHVLFYLQLNIRSVLMLKNLSK